MLKVLTGCILKIYPYRTLLKGYENFCTPPENMKCASYLVLIWKSVSVHLDGERKQHTGFQRTLIYILSNMYQKVRLRQKCRNENYMSKGVGVSSIPCGYKIWHIKMLPHIQDKCDSTLIWLDMSWNATHHPMDNCVQLVIWQSIGL